MCISGLELRSKGGGAWPFRGPLGGTYQNDLRFTRSLRPLQQNLREHQGHFKHWMAQRQLSPQVKYDMKKKKKKHENEYIKFICDPAKDSELPFLDTVVKQSDNGTLSV